MAQTQAGAFVPLAQARIQSIRERFLDAQHDALKLEAMWQELGRTGMSGWEDGEDALDWDNYPFTADQLKAALNKLDNVQEMALTDLSPALGPLYEIL